MSPSPGDVQRSGKPAGPVQGRRPVDTVLSLEQAARLCRAKQNQLESQVLVDFEASGMNRLDTVVADIALIFGILADHLESTLQEPA